MNNIDLLEEQIYTLVGSDVASILEVMGLEERFQSDDKFSKLLEYIKDNLTLPWSEIVEETIYMYLRNEELETRKFYK